MSYDPLPAIRELRAMIEVKHANDRLAVHALNDAEEILAKGGTAGAAARRVHVTRDILSDLDRPEAVAVLDLAHVELCR